MIVTRRGSERRQRIAQVNVRLLPGEWEQLGALAKDLGITRAEVLRRGIPSPELREYGISYEERADKYSAWVARVQTAGPYLPGALWALSLYPDGRVRDGSEYEIRGAHICYRDTGSWAPMQRKASE